MKKSLLDNGFVELINYMGDETTIVNAARVSYGKRVDLIGKKDVALLKYLWENKHTSPFEHVTFQFHVKCPLFVARQWMRHRTFSYNEISRRYTEENIEFHYPSVGGLRKQHINDKQSSSGFIDPHESVVLEDYMYNTTMVSLSCYNELLKSGVCREQARMILPQNMYTEFYVSGNLRNFLHFLELRMDWHAQEEIRVYAEAMFDMIREYVPNVCDIFLGDE